ncbi:MAG: 1-phosphofructokinase [Clostridiales bacterium]|nr:1-phosphofructokinase [Clostridiales bacterium]
MIYTVTFNPAIDYVVQLEDALRPGSLNRSASEEYQFGGKGINVSNMLKTLGYDTVALGFVAGFLGNGLEQGLRDMGLTTRFIHVAQGMTRINAKVKAEEETEINGIGPVITAEDMAQLYTQLDEIQPGDTLVLSGSIPRSLPNSTYAEILAHMEGCGVQIVVDAAQELLVSALRYHPFLIKPNHHELGELFGRELHSDEELDACATALQKLGARNVLVSLAEDGALLLDETGGCHRVRCPGGTVRNSVGAGDSMVAGFLAGWMERSDYDYALRLGTAAGSATAFSLGLAAREEIERLLQSLL